MKSCINLESKRQILTETRKTNVLEEDERIGGSQAEMYREALNNYSINKPTSGDPKVEYFQRSAISSVDLQFQVLKSRLPTHL